MKKTIKIPPSSTEVTVVVDATAQNAAPIANADGSITQPVPVVIIGDPVISGVTPPVTVPPPVVIPPPTTTGKILANLKFENASNIFEGKGSFNAYAETFGNQPPTIVTNPLGTDKVLRVATNSTANDSGRIRNELTIWPVPTVTGGTKQAYNLGIYIPAGFKADDGSNNFIQWHNAGKSGSIPNVSFMLKKNFVLDLNIAWATSASASTHTDVHYYLDASSLLGRNTNIGMIIKWMPDNTGFFELYKNGILWGNGKDFTGRYAGPMGYMWDRPGMSYVTAGPYLKWGLHYPAGRLPDGASETSQVVYYNNLIIGDENATIADVTPK